MGSGNSKPSSVSGANLGVNLTVPDATGRRLAILIGNNYASNPTIDNKLHASINDANNMKLLLDKMKFQCTLMTDNLSPSHINYPSKANILLQVEHLLKNLRDIDTLIIYYSGHGGTIPDTSGDEGGDKDSAMVPTTYNGTKESLLLDDELRTALLKANNGNVFVILDCCNAGTGCDLRYNLLSATYRNVISGSKMYNPGEWKNLFKAVQNLTYEETNTNIVSLSGSRDSEYSYEGITLKNAPPGYQNPGGVLTTSLFLTLGTQPLTSKFTDLIQKVKLNISTWGFPQTPQFMSGKVFNENTTFAQYMFK